MLLFPVALGITAVLLTILSSLIVLPFMALISIFWSDWCTAAALIALWLGALFLWRRFHMGSLFDLPRSAL